MCQGLLESLWVQSLLSQKSLSRSHPEAGYLAGRVVSLFPGFAFGFLGGLLSAPHFCCITGLNKCYA